MKKKHYIKDISDIKYCEENKIELYDEYQATVCFRFVDGIWCSYTNKNLNVYNVRLSLNSLYYEEESEEQQEATESDTHKLCWFGNKDRSYEFIDVLDGIEVCEIGNDKPFRPLINNLMWQHCRPLTKEEIKEFMEKAE